MRRLWYLLLSLAVLTLDQWTKYLVVASLPLGESKVVTSWFSIVHWRNSGGLWGILNNLQPHWRLAIFLILPLCGIVILAYLYIKAVDWRELLLLSAVLGGAAGNLMDRIRLGAVTDFLYFHIPNGPAWPAFNVADSFLSTGIIAYLVLSFFQSKSKEKSGAPGSVHDR